ncbi:hypothetical protein QTP88_014076 [Uroleucon formosanum]
MRVFELKEELLEFYSTEGNITFCELLKNEKWCAMLAYLADIFNYINSINTNMQGREENILTSTDKLLAFQKKIAMWKRKVTENNFEMFPLVPNNATRTLAPVISEHLISLEDKINKYFLEIEIMNYDWIRNRGVACIEAYKISIEKHNETKKSNRYVVSRLIDATCYLAKQELPFRGHDEQITSTNRGNYVELINLMGTLDLKLSGHLSTATVFSGLSGDIQNDLIQSISNVLMKRVTLEIKNVDFVSIIMDETTDVVSKSQLSIIFRYITHEGVQERFLGFVDVSQDRSAKCLAEYTFNILQGYNCENKLIAQTYDGAAVMSGQHNGLQALVRLKCKNAMFVHCYAHKLNLILKQSVDHIKECKVFFLTLSGLSSFFSKSTKRIYALEQEVKKKFPSVAPTRWNYNSRLVEMMSEYKQEVLNLMGTIIENGENFNLTFQEEEELISISADRSLKIKFSEESVEEFWISMKEQFSKISETALIILLQFSTSYLCELGFSTLTNIKTKKREKLLGVEEEIRVALSSIRPRISLITKNKQSQISH